MSEKTNIHCPACTAELPPGTVECPWCGHLMTPKGEVTQQEVVSQPQGKIVEPEPTPTPAISPSPSPTPNISPTPELTPEPTPEIYRTLIITATGKSYTEGADTYGFDDEQMMLLEEMMSPYYIGLFMEICGMSTYIGLTPDQVAELINNLPEGDLGAIIVEYALSRLGHPYSQPRRGQGNYVD